jgi:hypothetical protein
VNEERVPAPAAKLAVDSLEGLHRIEQETVLRLEKLANGGLLFLIDPLQALSDIGVELAPDVVASLVKLEPAIASSSGLMYAATKARTDALPVQIHLTGLFRPAKR